MTLRATKRPTRLQTTARHAIDCPSCKLKVPRLLSTTNHLERAELLCAIEYHEFKTSGRRVHS